MRMLKKNARMELLSHLAAAVGAEGRLPFCALQRMRGKLVCVLPLRQGALGQRHLPV